ncbi:MAG: hypothetical protein AAGD33_01955 [Actinomycetota bacterium]
MGSETGSAAVGSSPLLIFGPPRSGASAAAAVLARATSIEIHEPEPPTETHPYGSFESLDVIGAHRRLDEQLDTDATCPPVVFDAGAVELDRIERAIRRRIESGTGWAIKDTALTFLLPAWQRAGIRHAHLVVVVRPPFDAAASVAAEWGLEPDHAERLVELHLARIESIARSTPITLIVFDGDEGRFLDQLRRLADALGLEFDGAAASDVFDSQLVQRRLEHLDSTPEFDRLVSLVAPGAPPSRPADLTTLRPTFDHGIVLPRFAGERALRHRRNLHRLATFESVDAQAPTELVVSGTHDPDSACDRSDADRMHGGATVLIASPLRAAVALVGRGVHTDALVAHGLLDDLDRHDLDHVFTGLAAAMRPFAELVLDLPDPDVTARSVVVPPPGRGPSVELVRTVAASSGWTLVSRQRPSATRVAVCLRRASGPVSSDPDRAAAHETDLSIALDRTLLEVAELESERASLASRLEQSESELRRVSADLERLRSRRVVRFALRAVSPLAPLVRRARRVGGRR